MISWAEQLHIQGQKKGELKALRWVIIQVLTIRFPKADWSDITDLIATLDIPELEQVYTDTLKSRSARRFRMLLAEKIKTDA